MRRPIALIATSAAVVVISSCGDSGEEYHELSHDDPVFKAVVGCHNRISDDGERRADEDSTTDSRTPNRWIITGKYTLIATGEKFDYTCTATKSPGSSELSIDVPLQD